MISPRPAGHYAALTRKLCRLPKETEWVGFKRGRPVPQDLGKHISALSNSAACSYKPSGYMLWGVNGGARQVVGTAFRPETAKADSEPLETWLRRLLEPQIQFGFHAMDMDGKRVVLLEVECAPNQPVSFNGTEYIRAGAAAAPLRRAPGRERELWRATDPRHFTKLSAAELLDGEDVLSLLDYSAYFNLLKLPLPRNRRSILEALAGDGLLRPGPAGSWDITNLGALLFAEKFESFPGIQGKALRVVQYRGTDRAKATGKYTHSRGYASGFADLVDHVAALLQRHKAIEGPGRKKVCAALATAVRELIANALIHQDFTARNAGPALEIFANRIEVANPGEPLASPDRFTDAPPRSRNEDLAYFMRRFGYCEERGGGIERAVQRMEEVQLPAPQFETRNGFTRAAVFLHSVATAVPARPPA